jgi:hypothetical protein
VYKSIAEGTGKYYGMYILGSEFAQLPFWIFVVLLLLTLCSSLMNGSYRTSTRKTVELAPRPADAQGIETLPLGAGEGPGVVS